MSDSFPDSSSSSIPRPAASSGTILGSYTTYDRAQEVVDRLASARFDVSRLSILGRDLVNVERVIQRLSYPKIARSAALTGATMGLVAGIFLMLFVPDRTWTSIIPLIVIGACVWILFGVVGYSLQKGKKDFTSRSELVAARYEVVCDPESAAEAQRLLAAGASATQAAGPSQPGQSL